MLLGFNNKSPVPTNSASQSPASPVQAPVSFPEFIPPEAAPHSISLPPAFDELLREATAENQVKTLLPEFFNPLFRRQGVVNKYALQALESLGGSFTHLAQGIESRDRVLELLIAHFNQYVQADRTRANILTAALRTMDQRLRNLDDRLAGLLQKVPPLEERSATLESKVASLEKKSDDIQAQSAAREEALTSTVRASASGHQDLTAQIDLLRQELLGLAETSAQLTRRQESTASALGASTGATERLLPALETCLTALTGTHVPSQQEAAAKILEAASAAQTAQADGFYAALEARFRGPRSLIRERQSQYLPVIAEARNRVETFPPTPRAPGGNSAIDRLYAGNGVLDLGCGRGEWLELLKEQGVPALGVELNQFFLDACRQRGVDVAEANLVEFLKAVPAESVTAITGFHIIEHLPFPVLQEVVRDCFRILRRGGMAIFETPNPANILTSALNFRLDPTHQHPVHPALAQFILETGGFSSVRLEFLHAYEESQKVDEKGDILAERFNAYFYGPQDYAVMGVKP